MQEIVLIGCHRNVRKIASIKTIRNASHLGLKAAKKVFDDCLGGKHSHFYVPSAQLAQKLAQDLASLGVIVRVGNQFFGDDESEQPHPIYQHRKVGSFQFKELAHHSYPFHFAVTGYLLRGAVAPGDMLAIPLNSSLVIETEIKEIKNNNGLLTVVFEADDAFQHEIWEALVSPGENLVILSKKTLP